MRDAADVQHRTMATVEAAVAEFVDRHGDGPGAEVAVIIPAYNEEGGVQMVLAAVPATICGLRAEAIVVDDGSVDDTAKLAEDAGALVCRLTTNAGQGVALQAGYRLAAARGARFIATTDADGQLPAGQLPSLLAPVLDGTADFVNGSRRLGRSPGAGAVRAVGVVVFGGLISLLTGVRVTDPANGLRVWRREVTDRVALRQPQYQTSELLIRTIANGFRVLEVPVTVLPRTAGETKKGGNLSYGARFAWVIVATWWSEWRTARALLARPRGLWW